MSTNDALYEVEALAVRYRVRGVGARGAGAGSLHALDDVSLVLAKGESLGIVGESGSGKSTLVRALLGLVPPAFGDVRWRGRSLGSLTATERAAWRAQVQVVFQDPLASLDPRLRVRDAVAEPLRIHRRSLRRAEVDQRVATALESVGLPADAGRRWPHEFSGGQCQRIAIARALVLEPALIICDEAVSSLDVSVQAQILALLGEIRRSTGAAILFVSHNLAVVRQLCDRVLVLYRGRMMECGPVDRVLAGPTHPYTRLLLDSHPDPDPAIARERFPLLSDREAPSALDPPSGCVFRTRCPMAIDECATTSPAFEPKSGGGYAACLRTT